MTHAAIGDQPDLLGWWIGAKGPRRRTRHGRGSAATPGGAVPIRPIRYAKPPTALAAAITGMSRMMATCLRSEEDRGPAVLVAESQSRRRGVAAKVPKVTGTRRSTAEPPQDRAAFRDQPSSSRRSALPVRFCRGQAG